MNAPATSEGRHDPPRTGPARFFPVFPPRPWFPAGEGLSDAPFEPGRRMRVLFPLASSGPWPGGVLRAALDAAERTAARIAWEFAADDAPEGAENLAVLRPFASRHAMPVHVGRHARRPGCLDAVNLDLGPLLKAVAWDAVELTGWAHAATNRTVLEHARDALVVYSPHVRAFGTPAADDRRRAVLRTHDELLKRADLVLAGSPGERSLERDGTGPLTACVHLPHGPAPEAFRAGPVRRPARLLFLADGPDAGARFDLTLRVFARVRKGAPEYRLLVAGDAGHDLAVRVPRSLRTALEFAGRPGGEGIGGLCCRCRALLHLSESPTFGLPALEALACGTPVFLSRLGEHLASFGEFRGARFCPHDDPRAAARDVLENLAPPEALVGGAVEDVPRLRSAFDPDRVAGRKWRYLAAAWFRKNGLACPRDAARG